MLKRLQALLISVLVMVVGWYRGLAVQAAQDTGIDTHMHLQGQPEASGRRGPRGSERARGRLNYTEAAAVLISLMKQYGVAKAVVMPPPQAFGQRGGYEYRAFLKAIDRYPQRLYFAAGGGALNPRIHATDPSAVTPKQQVDFEAVAEDFVKAGAVAFGEMTAMHLCMQEWHHYLEAPADHPLFLALADASARYGVPIDLHVEAVPEPMPTPEHLREACSKNPARLPATIPGLERLLAHNRQARVVWQHIGWDNTGQMTVALIERLLAAHPNLFVAIRVEDRERQIGRETPMPNRIVDAHWRIRAEWLSLMEAFPDRFMVGGDEFIHGPGERRQMPHSFGETWSVVLEQLPAGLADKIGFANAARVYRLE